MEKVTRRGFMQGAAVLAAGAAAGGMIWKGVKEHGPVNIWMFFWSNKPTSIQGKLLSDELRDVFQVEVFADKGYRTIAEFKLSEIRKLVQMPGKKVRLAMAMKGPEGTAEGVILGVVQYRNLTFFMTEEQSSPVWLRMEDVNRVL